MDNKSLQTVTEILRRIPLPEIQEHLSDSPLLPAGTSASSIWPLWLERPVQLALQYGLEPVAHALGADPQELLAYIHPHCPNATACFQRLTLLRPDRVWGGERVYICRTVRPISMRWNGPDSLELDLVEGAAEIERGSRHSGHGSPTIHVTPSTTLFFSHPSTFIVRHSWITDLVDHAVAAGIPVTLPPLSPAAAEQTGVHASPSLARHFRLTANPLGYPKL